jgi:hypothetical protein
MKKRVWASLYSAPPSVLRRGTAEKTDGEFNYVHPWTSLHMLRDGEATLNLFAILAHRYSLVGKILNLPPGVFAVPGEKPGQIEVLGPPSPIVDIREGDLIIQATRFPLDDNPEFDKNCVLRSGSALEAVIGAAQRLFFSHCSRQAVILSESAARCCRQDALKYRAVQFSSRRDERTGRMSGFAVRCGNISDLQYLDRCQELPGDSLIGYLTFVPAAGESGPAFLNVFGLNGTGTLLWSEFVRDSLSERVSEIVQGQEPRLLVYRFQPTFVGKSRPSQLTLTTVEQPEVLLDASIVSQAGDAELKRGIAANKQKGNKWPQRSCI